MGRDRGRSPVSRPLARPSCDSRLARTGTRAGPGPSRCLDAGKRFPDVEHAATPEVGAVSVCRLAAADGTFLAKDLAGMAPRGAEGS